MNDVVYKIVNDRTNEISHRLDCFNGEYYTTIEEAFERVRVTAADIAMRLSAIEHDLYSYLNSLSETNTNEKSEAQNTNSLGKFWEEIEQNNMFLQNLK